MLPPGDDDDDDDDDDEDDDEDADAVKRLKLQKELNADDIDPSTTVPSVPQEKELEYSNPDGDKSKAVQEPKHSENHRINRSVLLTAVLGLSCGVVVVMLFVVIALIMRRQRIVKTRVIISENNDDREHLVKMQKNGFENPTYKFFYF